MKQLGIIIGVVFAVVLAIVVGSRMSGDAMAVVVGVVCGVLASIPTSLLIVWALGKRGLAAESATSIRNEPATQYPPIVVVNPGQGYNRPGMEHWSNYRSAPDLPSPDVPRSFKIVGDAETVVESAEPVWSGR